MKRLRRQLRRARLVLDCHEEAIESMLRHEASLERRVRELEAVLISVCVGVIVAAVYSLWRGDQEV